MTIGEWLRERSPNSPPRLLARIEEELGPRLYDDASAAGDVCINAAESMLGQLLERKSAGRESALDLLTVDALVTYAFEAVAQTPAAIVPTAQDAFTRLAAVARV